MTDDIIKFVRQRDFILRRELGQGACGRTVLLYDDTIDEYFVCKKYAPYIAEWREELFNNFRREIKLLHLLHHPNVVRVFNYFLYPQNRAGYILMEFIEGSDIQDYLHSNPEDAANIFRQAIDAFQYLETNNILHRDIRPANFMVTTDGRLKVIDFGFGKQIATVDDYGKSISLNWWCELPSEFSENIYDFRTEVYFVGKLFEKIIAEMGVGEFEYAHLLGKMCCREPESRISSFANCRTALLDRGISDPKFDSDDLRAYRQFSWHLHQVVSKLEAGTKYLTEQQEVLRRLEALYPKVMLEENIPANDHVIHCFLDGAYYYTYDSFPTSVLHSFLTFFRSCSRERRSIVLGNLHSKLDSIKRYQPADDDIPF